MEHTHTDTHRERQNPLSVLFSKTDDSNGCFYGVKKGGKKKLLPFMFHFTQQNSQFFLRPFCSYLRICDEVKAITQSKAGKVRQI
jgi:hypothetical protein